MKNTRFTLFCLVVFVLGALKMSAQDSATKIETPVEEEEEGPLMYRFEPDFIASNEQKSMDIDRARKILDTLQISDRKRRRLLKDLYKNEFSERLQKALVADIKFEEVDE